MKITAKNVIEKWDEIKPLLPKELAQLGEESFLPFADMYDDFDEEMHKDFDLFLEKVNKFTDKPAPKPEKPKEDKPKPQPKPAAKPKAADKPKTEKTPKEKKAKKAGKTKVGENPDWLKTLKSFVKSFAGKYKETWRVREFVKDIQARFSKKHGNSTPNIDLIIEIQDKLLKFANSDEQRVSIPEYAELVSKCKKAIKDKDFTVSKKTKKPELSAKELSGFSIGFSKRK